MLAGGCLTNAARAAAPFDVAAQGIDRVCDAYAPAAGHDAVLLVRAATHDGSVPRWQRSDAAAEARLQAAPDFSGADYATVLFDHGSIVTARTVRADAPPSYAQTRAWCFIGGKLSRSLAEAEIPGSGDWRHTVYYGDDLERPLSDYVTPAPGNQTDRHAQPPADALQVDAFATPAALPFYAAAVAAHGSPRRG